jgi:hypothetical protein
MSVSKLKSESAGIPKHENGRRSFIRKAGVAVSAVLATAASGLSKTASNKNTDAGKQNDLLHEVNAVRDLQRMYEFHLSQGHYDEVPALFAKESEVVFNGGTFKGDKGIRRLYCERFRQGQTGKKIEAAPGYETDPLQSQDIVDVAPDGKSATGRFFYSIQVGNPIQSESSLVAMARLLGEGIYKWWEGGIQEVRYVKEGTNWKIKRIEYRVESKADYRPGRSYARSIEVPAFTKTFPSDPTGPDIIL